MLISSLEGDQSLQPNWMGAMAGFPPLESGSPLLDHPEENQRMIYGLFIKEKTRFIHDSILLIKSELPLPPS